MEKLIWKVEGMRCEGCENRIQKKLMTFEEVESVKASHEKKQVEIVLKQKMDEQILKDAISDIGFEVL